MRFLALSNLAGWWDAEQFEPVIVASGGVFSAARETGGRAAEGTDSFESDGAMRALVDELSNEGASGEREIVTARFVYEAEVDTGLLPFGAVWRDFAATDAVLSQKVG